MENSPIEWTDHTFNPWVGCEKVSAACKHCYAESWAKRTGSADLWKGERRRTSEANWRKPLLWNRRAAERGVRERVFCASLADVFEDRDELKDWRLDLFQLIMQTPALDWLLLTKRPEKILEALGTAAGQASIGGSKAELFTWVHRWATGEEPPANVWLGTTVEDQERAEERVPELLSVPAAVHFLSCEPLLGPVRLDGIEISGCEGTINVSVLTPDPGSGRVVSWVIAGGESGGKARPSHPDWFHSLRDQCQQAGVPFFFKQWGEWIDEGAIGDPFRAQRPENSGSTTFMSSGDLGDVQMIRVGKKRSGRELHGIEWNQVPKAG